MSDPPVSAPLRPLGVLAVDEDVDVLADLAALVAHPRAEDRPGLEGSVEHLPQRRGVLELDGGLVRAAGEVPQHTRDDHPVRSWQGEGRTQYTSGRRDASNEKDSPPSVLT